VIYRSTSRSIIEGRNQLFTGWYLKQASWLWLDRKNDWKSGYDPDEDEQVESGLRV